jgi:hypothetical protein
MEAMRESWTDGRLDDFSHHVDERFNRVEAELRTQRFEMKTEFASLRREMDSRFDSVQRLILQVGGGMIGILALGILTVLATRL